MSASEQQTPPAVFVLGAPRSGTSLTFRSLCVHPDAAWVSNWLAHSPRTIALAALNRVGRTTPEGRLDAWFHADRNAYVFGRRRSVGQRLRPNPVEALELHRRWGLANPVGAQRRSGELDDPARFGRNVTRLVRWSGARVFVDKSIDNNRRVEVIRRALPGARFVVVTRDGRAVTTSLSRVGWWSQYRLWWWHGTPDQWEAEGRDPILACARHWQEEVRSIDEHLRGVPEHDVLRIRYEDLVADPVATLASMGSFSGLGADASWEAVAARIPRSELASSWQDGVSSEELSTIEAALGEDLARLGYI